MTTPSAVILLVEDNDDDADLTVRAFERAKLDGIGMLKALRADQRLHHIPAVILTLAHGAKSQRVELQPK